LSATRVHLAPLGLPPIGIVEIETMPLQGADAMPFARVGKGEKFARLYAPVEGYKRGMAHVFFGRIRGFFKLNWFVLTDIFLHASTSGPVTLPSAKALMRHAMRFKPRHSALRSIDSWSPFLTAELNALNMAS